jgi:hypothetical protein
MIEYEKYTDHKDRFLLRNAHGGELHQGGSARPSSGQGVWNAQWWFSSEFASEFACPQVMAYAVHIAFTSCSHRVHIMLTSRSHRVHIAVTSRLLTSCSHRVHIAVTSRSHRACSHHAHIAFTSCSHRVHIAITSCSHRVHIACTSHTSCSASILASHSNRTHRAGQRRVGGGLCGRRCKSCTSRTHHVPERCLWFGFHITPDQHTSGMHELRGRTVFHISPHQDRS